MNSNESIITNNDERFKILFTLLNKAESVLAIINLPDSTMKKYNQLKELTFDKLGIEFKPVVKIGQVMVSNKATGNLCDNDYVNKLRSLNQRKSLVIEFLFDLIEKFKFENIKPSSVIEENFNRQLDKIFSNQLNISKNNDELEFEFKMEEIKIKDYLGKSDIFYKKFLNNNFKPYSVNDTNLNEIISDYERKIEDVKRNHERELKEFRDRMNELKIKYNPQLENEFFNLKNNYEEIQFLIEKINEMLIPVYDKYYPKNVSWYENEKIEFKYEELEKINFLILLVNKFFNDNKYLIDLVSNLQKDKSDLIEERNLPYVINSITKNSVLNEIYEESKLVEKNNQSFHNNFLNLIEFIDKNFENI